MPAITPLFSPTRFSATGGANGFFETDRTTNEFFRLAELFMQPSQQSSWLKTGVLVFLELL